MDVRYFVCGRLKKAEGAQAAAVVLKSQLTEWKQRLEDGSNIQLYQPRSKAIRCSAVICRRRPDRPKPLQDSKKSPTIKIEVPELPTTPAKFAAIFTHANSSQFMKKEPEADSDATEPSTSVAESKNHLNGDLKPDSPKLRKRIRIPDSDSDSDDLSSDIVSKHDNPNSPEVKLAPNNPIDMKFKKQRLDGVDSNETSNIDDCRAHVIKSEAVNNTNKIKTEIKHNAKLTIGKNKPRKKKSSKSNIQQTSIMSYFAKK